MCADLFRRQVNSKQLTARGTGFFTKALGNPINGERRRRPAKRPQPRGANAKREEGERFARVLTAGFPEGLRQQLGKIFLAEG